MEQQVNKRNGERKERRKRKAEKQKMNQK